MSKPIEAASMPIARGNKEKWVSVNDRLPPDNTRIDCKYEGVYELRENILFWYDQENHHFGGFLEIDGKGSQPATHWRLTVYRVPSMSVDITELMYDDQIDYFFDHDDRLNWFDDPDCMDEDRRHLEYRWILTLSKELRTK